MLLNFCVCARVKAILQHPETVMIIQCTCDILQKCGEMQGDMYLTN